MMKKLLTFLVAMSFFCSCHFVGGERVRGNGDVIIDTRQTGHFSGVDVSGSVDVYVRQDSVFSVRVETDANIQPHLIVETRGDALVIRPERHINLRPTRLKVYVSAPLFKSLDASGACKIISENRLSSGQKMFIDLSGSCDVSIDLKIPEVKADLSGSGTIDLRGEAKDLEISGSGSTKVRCFDLKTENVSVDISGSGHAEVFASVKLDVGISGSGDIRYKGSPTVSQHISGSGSVRKVD